MKLVGHLNVIKFEKNRGSKNNSDSHLIFQLQSVKYQN
jgi:hypothetical protein